MVNYLEIIIQLKKAKQSLQTQTLWQSVIKEAEFHIPGINKHTT